MKLHVAKVLLVFLLVFVWGIFITPTSVKAYPCGASCALNVNGCDAGLTCRSNICGQVYNACTGSVCGASNGWVTSGCAVASCGTANSTRTSVWSYTACTASCGLNTRIGTCVDQNQNACASQACTIPAGAIGSTYTDNATCACINNAPLAPTVTSAGNGSCTTTGTINVNWTHGVTGCGGWWGYACPPATATNIYIIRDGGVEKARVAAGTYTASATLTSGVHIITVCASNNNGTTQVCSAAYNTTIGIDTSPPSVPAPAITATPCSGTVSVAWPAVSDVGCFGAVQYNLQTKDSAGSWYQNGWLASTSIVITNSPTIGLAYQAQVLSGDNGASHTNQSAWSAGAMWNTGVTYCCPIAPTLINPIGSTCNGPTFPATYSWNAVTGAAGYNLTISKGGTPCLSTSVGNAAVLNVVTASPNIAACAALGTGTYSWTVQATYSGGCAPSSLSTVGSFDYDVTAPGVPAPVMTQNSDPACWGKSIVGVTWSSVSDTGCAGLNTLPYKNQISTNSFTSFVDSTFNNAWANPPVPTPNKTITSYLPGTILQTRVMSQDSKGNSSNWSATQSITIPVPTPYPTIHISGSYSENINNVITNNMIIDKNSLTFNPVATFNPPIALNPSNNAGIVTECAINKTDSTYECTIEINNITGLCVSPNITFSLNASYPGYGSVDWRAGNDCTGAIENARNFTVGDNQIAFPLCFQYQGADVTGGGWFKLSQTSFNSRMSERLNYLPYGITKFDTTNDDSIATKNVNIGTAGNMIRNGGLIVGLPTAPYSSNDWYTSGYIHTNDISYMKYIDYIKARKDFSTITNTDLSGITESGIYYIKNASVVTLSASRFNGKNVVLIVDEADAQITSNFIPVNGSVAILAKNIKIDQSVTEVDALLIAQTVDTGSGSSGLKIRGNLIDEAALTIGRTQTDGSKPSLFVIFDPTIYMGVLPYLSTSTYDWRQIQ